MPMTDLNYQVICSRSISKTEKEVIIIISITEEEEKALDNGFLKTTKGGQTFTIHGYEVICYGEIDFDTNSEDYLVIEDMNWLNYLDVKGIYIPADYNYDEHCCYPPERRVRYTETFNPAVLTQYLYAKLGKPKRCCIFKEKRNGRT